MSRGVLAALVAVVFACFVVVVDELQRERSEYARTHPFLGAWLSRVSSGE